MQQLLTQLNLPGLAVEDLIFDLTFLWGARFLKVLIIFLLARLALRFGYSVIQRLFNRDTDAASPLPGSKAKTLAALLYSVWRYVIYAAAAVLILTELAIVEMGPILAGAGVIGLAVGFGAQSLVRDVIAGFFIVLEDQFSVGDYITVGNFTGTVEELGLRITKIRDFSGELHIIPNGKIEAVTNRTRGSMRAQVDVSVAYEEDIDQVLAVLEDLSRRFREERPEVVEGPVVLGVIDLEDSGVVVRIIARTVPMTQWKVERDLRRAVKKELEAHGIEIPYPRRVIYSRQEKKEDLADG